MTKSFEFENPCVILSRIQTTSLLFQLDFLKGPIHMDELPEGDYEGIRHVHALDFLGSSGVAGRGAEK
jgi:hypothetical protein